MAMSLLFSTVLSGSGKAKHAIQKNGIKTKQKKSLNCVTGVDANDEFLMCPPFFFFCCCPVLKKKPKKINNNKAGDHHHPRFFALTPRLYCFFFFFFFFEKLFSVFD